MISPTKLSAILGQKHAPTSQQAEVIGAAPGPLLVVAGAGAGKTETMANRVVWLVANGYAAPDQVLGLTFTRKAAQQLAQRIRARLSTFAATPVARRQDPSGELEKQLESINPTVSTYDSYAGRLVQEYGLLLPVEPTARLITDTELFHIARQVVAEYPHKLSATQSVATVVKNLLALSAELDNHMVSHDDVLGESTSFVQRFEEIDRGRSSENFNTTISGWIDTQQLRLEYLPLVTALKAELSKRQVITFGEQMTLAARLAESFPEVGEKERRKFRVVMLDEYQDTSHSQRVLLRSLFGSKDPDLTVTAVGDPMQSIYGWRGATAANLERFTTDFATASGPDGERTPAEKKQLTVSFRNPSQVLSGANAVSGAVFDRYNQGKRTVEALTALPGKDNGAVQLGWFQTPEQEQNWVADYFTQTYHSLEPGEPFTAAILVRKKSHIEGYASALAERGVPYEVVGLSGLLLIPEVADLVAIATMLIDPTDNAAALRVLTGPLVQLGASDLLGLQQRAANLAGRARRKPTQPADEDSPNPLEKLEVIIAENVATDEDTSIGLVDAVADLGEPDFYTEVGYYRLRELAAMLRHLRTYSLGRNLTDLFADIEEVFGIRTEVLSRQDPHADGASGTIHLDSFAAEVASFEAIPGASLRSLLDYFALALEHEDGLEPGEVKVRSNRVQILTVHKSKGLEWQHVAVVRADNSTYLDEHSNLQGQKLSTWVTDVTKVPSTLRGDVAEGEELSGIPEFEAAEAEVRSDLEKAVKAHIEEFRDTFRQEAARLFYVAITRSEHNVLVTGSANTGGSKVRKPYVYFDLLRSTQPENVVHWEDGASAEEENPAQTETLSAVFPTDPLGKRRPHVEAAAERVRHMLANVLHTDEEPELTQLGEQGQQWHRDVTALIEEHRRLSSTKIEVPLGQELTATDLVALERDPVFFAQRTLRPVPFKPNAYAKRGTAFHEWLERRFGSATLLDDEELMLDAQDTTEVMDNADQLAELQEKFLASEWAERQPAQVEAPFEVAIGNTIVRGRIDAIFHEGEDPANGWLVVDWKTGRKPRGSELAAAAIQLAVYRYAWAQLVSKQHGIEVDPESIKAAFYYVAEGETYAPGKLPTAANLAKLVGSDEA
ncbi:UvrD-helicase domain-containing protein [Corynebacterium epidermidicanis]|uniref:UvrD-helicase domain-containing protein n=1 Tax=Corynebacterium epidermidicanis TaxID=1050174 RepID=UPI00064156A2|nr:UvrD-helicase domain-containing protein [Corynebacterium epidermidicanis]